MRGPPNYCSILIFKATAIHLFLLIATPSPVLGSFYSHTSHLCPSVHKDFTLEIRYLDPFHQLATHRLVVAVHHIHCVVDVCPTLMVVDRVKPQDRDVHVSC